MADIEKIKVGNTSYDVRDASTLQNLTPAQETQILTDGTYNGEGVSSGTVFTDDDGSFRQFNKIPSPSASFETKTNPSEGMGRYVCGDGNGTVVYVVQTTQEAAYSTDNGMTWTSSTLPSVSTYNWRGVAYGSGKFVVCGQGCMAYSSDGGATWSLGTGISSGSVFMAICYGGGKFVACGTNGRFAYSEDGVSWTESTNSSTMFATICYGNGIYTAINTGSNKGYYSSNGTSWTSYTPGISGQDSSTLAFDGENFVLVFKAASAGTAKSSDGHTWNVFSNNTHISNVTQLSCGNGFYVISDGSTSGSDDIEVSFDALNWVRLSVPSGRWPSQWYDPTNERFILVGTDVKILTPISTYDYSLVPLSYNKTAIDNSSVILGTSNPTTSTKGSIGQTYLNTSSGAYFICKNDKTPDYTLQGSPTISADYIASGFSSTKYIKIPYAFAQNAHNGAWKVRAKITLTTLNEWSALFGGASGTYMPDLFINAENVLAMNLSSNGSGYDITGGEGVVKGTYVFSANTDYWVQFGWDGTTYFAEYSTDGKTYTRDISLTSSTPIESTADQLFIGFRIGNYFRGTVDLKEVEIEMAGSVVWSALKAYYTWGDVAPVDQTYSASSTNAQSGVAINNAGFVRASANSSTSLGIGDSTTASSYCAVYGPKASANANGQYSSVFGYNAYSQGSYGTAIGYQAKNQTGNHGIAIGREAVTSASYAIQLGRGTNSTQGTMSVALSSSDNYQLLKADGTIPHARLTNIKETYTNPALTATSDICTWTVTHTLATRDVIATVYDTTTYKEVLAEIIHTDDSTLTINITSSTDIAADAYKVVIIG